MPSSRGEFRPSAAVRSGFIVRPSFGIKPVQYTVRNGLAMFEGDIVLGTEEHMATVADTIRANGRGMLTTASLPALLIPGNDYRWPRTIPYDVDPDLPDQARAIEAIRHWNELTGFNFVQFNSAEHSDWITFRPGAECSSPIGRQGGQQFINLHDDCDVGSAIHEIGHAVGFWHEQSRDDRDYWVTINWDKIMPGEEYNFSQHINDGWDYGRYDYDSIMHYSRDAFSTDGSDTIVPTHPGVQIGQRRGLSATDCMAAYRLLSQRDKNVYDKPYKDYKEVGTDIEEPEHAGVKLPFAGITAPFATSGPSPFVLAMPRQALRNDPGLTTGAGFEVRKTVALLQAQLQSLDVALAAARGGHDTLQRQYDQTARALRKMLGSEV